MATVTTAGKKATDPAQEKRGPWTPQFLAWSIPASLGIVLGKTIVFLLTQAGKPCSCVPQRAANVQMAGSSKTFSTHWKAGKRKCSVSSGTHTTGCAGTFFFTQRPEPPPWARLVPREAGRESLAGTWFPE